MALNYPLFLEFILQNLIKYQLLWDFHTFHGVIEGQGWPRKMQSVQMVVVEGTSTNTEDYRTAMVKAEQSGGWFWFQLGIAIVGGDLHRPPLLANPHG